MLDVCLNPFQDICLTFAHTQKQKACNKLIFLRMQSDFEIHDPKTDKWEYFNKLYILILQTFL